MAAYILAGVFVEVTHHDQHDLLLRPHPVLARHECGAKEIHRPLDRQYDCLACTQSAIRISTAAPSPVDVASFLCLGDVFVNHAPTLYTDVIYSGKRGPPPPTSFV